MTIMRGISHTWTLLTLILVCSATLFGQTRYTVPARPWPESMGNHRAIVRIAKSADAIRVTIPWRRHDVDPDQKRLMVIEASSGDTIPNLFRIRVDHEMCDIVVGPVRKVGMYYCYYLPYEVQPGWGYYNRGYFPPEPPPPAIWVKRNDLGLDAVHSKLQVAEITEIQSRSAFDSFFPMEIIPTSEEKQTFLRKHNGDYLLFAEDRLYPIRMKDDIPFKWLPVKPGSGFSGTALRNEYYAFQIGVYAAKKELAGITVEFSSLSDDRGNTIPANRLTCFNTEGRDPAGKYFTKTVDVPKGGVQPLWIGVDIGKEMQAGNYSGTITVRPEGLASRIIPVRLRIADSILADRGDGEPWKHSRLRWLNSTLGLDSSNVAPYTPVMMPEKNRFALLGHEISVAAEGLPMNITSGGTEILAAPMQFVVETGSGNAIWKNFRTLRDEVQTGIISREAEGENEDLRLTVSSSVEADGYCHYNFRLSARKTVRLNDVRLLVPVRPEVAEYMMGMGLMGTRLPDRHYAVWEETHDSFWIGNTLAGLWFEFRGARYSGPLLAFFKPEPPASWWNVRKGGFVLEKTSSSTRVTVFSGDRILEKDHSIDFEFSILITPVKKLNTAAQFRDRYYHGGNLVPNDDEVQAGARIINLHHANAANPYINYPFLAVGTLKGMVDAAHARGLKLKLYYTIREMTSHATEFWALRSLGQEIFADGPGGGYPWLREHCGTGYSPQWYQHFDDEALGVDASILNSTGPSRWYNYYIEGLSWLIKNVGIDGLYLDDVAYDRQILKRMRKVMDTARPGCLIDLHSNTYFSKGPAVQYTEFFPYIDKLWFGEGFQYDRMPPENWLVEVSGIPFGLMGDMLEGGGNPWRGMVYGMAVRYPWITDEVQCDPRALWKIWDEFGIVDATMIGYWNAKPAVVTDHAEVLATTYKREGKAMIALASWAERPADVHLTIDWAALGFDGKRATLRAPRIENFQPAGSFSPAGTIRVDPRKGWILLVESPR
jgi:hypothetical protein